MQLQELKILVEYDAVVSLVASQVKGGWVLLATTDAENYQSSNAMLDLARGGTRFFKTLDALSKLVKKELYGAPFTVC
ncbi:MAG: hypothetical protein GY787_31695 [Alteromonadales bacterium]|nr:hypothetical protein [Alteromonadales bacterium]